MDFDHSSYHGAMAEDFLDVSKMNVKPQKKKMNYNLSIPKGVRAVLEERGVNTKGMNGDKMREILGSHNGFKNVKSRVEQF